MLYKKRIQTLKGLCLINLIFSQPIKAQDLTLQSKKSWHDSETYAYLYDASPTKSSESSITEALLYIDQLHPTHTSAYLKNIVTLIKNGDTSAPKQHIQNAVEDACLILKDYKNKIAPEKLDALARVIDEYYQKLDTDQLIVDKQSDNADHQTIRATNNFYNIFVNNRTHTRSLTVAQDASFTNINAGGNANVAGATNLNSLAVSGPSYFNDTVTIDADLFVTGTNHNVYIDGGVYIDGDLRVTGSIITISSVIITATTDLTLFSTIDNDACIIFEENFGDQTVKGKICANAIENQPGLNITTPDTGILNFGVTTDGNDNVIHIGDASSTSANTITIGNSSGTGVNTVTIGQSATAASTINIGTGDTTVKTIHIGDGAAANLVTVGSTTGAASLALQSGTGNVTVNIGTTGNINANSTSATAGNARGSSAVDLQLSRGVVTQVASGTTSALLGGHNNTASNTDAVVVGGTANVASQTQAGVIGGSGNTASGAYAVVAGGNNNTAATTQGFIGGGSGNATATNSATAVIGGTANSASGSASVIIGGDNNTISSAGTYSVILGGQGNSVTGVNGAALSGASNTVSANYSIAAGQNATAGHLNSFVWSDGTVFGSTLTKTFNVNATNGIILSGPLTQTGGNVSLSADAVARTITIGNNTSTTQATINVGTGNAGGDFVLAGPAGSILNFGTADNTHTFNVGTGNAIQTINIGTHNTPVNVIGIGGAASQVTIKGAPVAITGNTNINITGSGTTNIGVGGTGAVSIGNSTGNTTISAGDLSVTSGALTVGGAASSSTAANTAGNITAGNFLTYNNNQASNYRLIPIGLSVNNMPNSQKGVRMAGGTINADGSITGQTTYGFGTVSRTSDPGVYVIEFNPTFTVTPLIMTAIGPSNSPTAADAALVQATGTSNSQVTINVRSGDTNNLLNQTFSIFAIGY